MNVIRYARHFLRSGLDAKLCSIFISCFGLASTAHAVTEFTVQGVIKDSNGAFYNYDGSTSGQADPIPKYMFKHISGGVTTNYCTPATVLDSFKVQSGAFSVTVAPCSAALTAMLSTGLEGWFLQVEGNFIESQSAPAAYRFPLQQVPFAILATTANAVSDNAIVTASIANDAVTAAKIATGAVTTAKIADLAVDDDKLAANSVVTAKIADAQVTLAKLANPGSDGFLKVASGTWSISSSGFGTTDIADNAITNAKMADNAINTVELVDGAVTTAKLATDAVTTVKITDANVTTAKLADNAVTTVKITDANVTTAKLADNAVTTVKITDANVTTAKLADDAVTNAKLADNAVDTAQIVDGSVTSAKLAAGLLADFLKKDGSVNATGDLNFEAEKGIRLQDAAGGQYVGFKAPATVTTSHTYTWPDFAGAGDNGKVLTVATDGTLSWTAAAAAGETNTASNVTGTTGVGLYKQKTGVDLEFKSLLAGSNKISISGGASDVTLDITEANLTHNNIGGTLGVTKGGTGLTTVAAGDILYGSAADTITALPKATNGQVLTLTAGLPAWADSTTSVANLTGDTDKALLIGNGATAGLNQTLVSTANAGKSLYVNNSGDWALGALDQGSYVTFTDTTGALTVALADVATTANDTLAIKGKTLDATTTLSTGATLIYNGTTWGYSTDTASIALRSPSMAGNPTARANGDLWYDSTADKLMAYIDGGNVELGGAPDLTPYLKKDGSENATGDLNFEAEKGIRLQDAAGGQYVGFKAPATVTTSHTYTWPDFAGAGDNGKVLTVATDGTLSWTAVAAAGETNTASNVTGTTGVGLYKQKTGVDLEFKSLLAGSTKLSVTSGASDVSLDVVEANLDIANMTGTLPATRGGTGQTTATTGDMLYASGANTWSKLAAGTNGHVLTLAGGLPSWAAPAAPTSVGGFTDDTDKALLIGNGATAGLNQTLVSTANAGKSLYVNNSGDWALGALDQGSYVTFTDTTGALTVSLADVATTANSTIALRGKTLHADMATLNNTTDKGATLVFDGTDWIYSTKASAANGIKLPFDASAPTEGQLWYDNTADAVKFRNSTTDITLASAAGVVTSVSGGDGITIGGTATTPTITANIDTAATTGGLKFDGSLPKKIQVNVDDSTIEVGGSTVRVKDAGITAAKLATDSVTTVKITDANVTTAKLATDAVTTVKITDANVTTAKIADSNVTTAKINNGAVTAAKLSPTVPVTASTTWVLEYSVAGAAQAWTQGTDTNVASTYVKRSSTGGFSAGPVVLTANADASIPLTAKAFSGTQSANLQEWQNSSGTVQASVSSSGTFISVPTTTAYTSGADLDMSTSNIQVLSSSTGDTIKPVSMTVGGVYTVVLNFTSSYTYTVGGGGDCTNTYYSPAQDALSASRAIFNIFYAASGTCYVSWSEFQ